MNIEGTNLATLVPSKPKSAPKMMSAYSSTDIDSINSDIAAFTSSGNSDVSISYSEPNVNETLLVMPEYQNTDLQVA